MLYEWLVEPWSWGAWMWRGLLASVLVAVPCAVLGVFLYLRRMSMLADALAHVALPGIVAAFLLSGSVEGPVMIVGAAAMGLVASVLIETLGRVPMVRSDAAIGVVFTAMFAGGVIALTRMVEGAHIDTDCVLFGNVLGISDLSLWTLGIVAPLVVGLVALGYRWLAVSSFDPGLARSLGVPVVLVHYALTGSVALTTVAAFEAVGAVLVIALVVVPAATAHLLADRLGAMLGWAVAHGVVSALVGLYVSVWINCSTAGAIVVVGGVFYGLAFFLAPRHGVVPVWWRSRQRSTPAAAMPSAAE